MTLAKIVFFFLGLSAIQYFFTVLIPASLSLLSNQKCIRFALISFVIIQYFTENCYFRGRSILQEQGRVGYLFMENALTMKYTMI